MLTTSEERIKLLKAGFSIKTIEQLYIKNNNLRIIFFPVLKEILEYDRSRNEKPAVSSKAAVEYAHDLCV
jgi:hypothetical protein